MTIHIPALCRLLLTAALLSTSAAGAANLIENPGFDDDLAGWIALGATTLEHAATDELGSPVSGSMRLQAQTATQTSVNAATCVPVSPSRFYALGAGARIPAGLGVDSLRATVSVFWSSTADCSLLDLGSEVHGQPHAVTLAGVWGTTQTGARSPEHALSARLQLQGIASPDPAAPLEISFDNAFFLEDATCGPSHMTLCLDAGRFRLTAQWATPRGDRGYGQATAITADAGWFWFFNDANVELVAKLLDACSTGFHTFWFFAAGLTNVETVIRVDDTIAGIGRVYVNLQGTPFAPIQDTDAFDTCPRIGG
jgi:hypothetical protein